MSLRLMGFLNEGMMMMNQARFEQVKSYRRELHKIPELSYELYKTHDYIKATLEGFGYETFTVAKTGIIAVKEGTLDQGIAFRADMDGLNIKENTHVTYRSTHEGLMHGCGHDGHMAMLLGFAKEMKEIQTKKRIMFVFEPAEETFGGAKDIVASNVFSQYNIEMIFALHLYPELEEGKLGLKEGILTAQDGDFDMHISGRNAHGTQPHLGSDVALAASALTMQYHTIIGRSMNPLKPSSINVGTMHLGEGRNILAHEAILKGSIRAFEHSSYTLLKKRMRQIDKGIEEAYNVTIENQITDLHPPVYNDGDLTQTIIDTLAGSDYEYLAPQMLAEDFSYYQQVIPGVFIMLGSKNIPKGFTYPLHSNRFNFDESVLLKGIDTFNHIAHIFKAI